jgi:hypothetical protein
MPRKRQKKVRQNVLGIRLLEDLARDPRGEFKYRVFCATAICVGTGVFEMDLIFPGTRRPREQSEQPDILPPEEIVDNTEAKRMLEALNATNPQSDGSTDKGLF